MIRKEQLLRINGLRLVAVINSMNDSQYAAYIRELDTFVDRFPRQADGITAALESGQYELLGRRLSELHDALAKLHADSLAADCKKQAQNISASGRNIDRDALEAAVENLIQGISALSIDVQMAAHQSAAAPPARAARQSFSGANVLAVDNAIMFLNTLKKLLSDSPYELHCVTSGAEALDYLERNRPDVILLDIEMPDMDGYELARRIKRSGSRTPIIFITANSSREYIDKAVEVGADGLLMKPLRVNQLLAKLKEVL